MQKEIWAIIFLTAAVEVYAASVYLTTGELMKCSYGERGSLTATCVNATPSYFKNTPYRFDQLDETLRCLNCTLNIIDSGTFDISGNQIRNLDLTNSQIDSLKQKAFVGLIFLENLNLSNNKIRSIYPGTFTGVKKIKNIDLSNNELHTLSDDGFMELIALEKLNLEQNAIETIATRAFSGMSSLRELNLRHNRVTALNDVFNNITSLQVLNLEENLIGFLKGTEFFNLSSLLDLKLAYNSIENPLIEFKPQSILRSITLHHNAIKTIAPSFLKGLHTLETLDLSFNNIETINQKTLQNLYNLRNLNITHNYLKSIQTGTFSALPQLQVLNCSYNKIEKVEITGVFSLHSVHALDLSNNHLRDLDYIALISRLPALSYLRIENNILPCYLEKEMDDYFAEDNFKYILYDNSVGSLKCVEEEKLARSSISDKLIGEEKPVEKGISGGEVTILVLISFVLICIGFLFYLQYRTYQNLKHPSSSKTMSVANLIAEDANGENDDYLKE